LQLSFCFHNRYSGRAINNFQSDEVEQAQQGIIKNGHAQRLDSNIGFLRDFSPRLALLKGLAMIS
jgi:hypothetical protein